MTSPSWKEGQLSDIAHVVMGQSPKKEFVNFSEDGLPLLNGPSEFGFRHPSPVQWTTKATKESEIGDLLFCVRGSTAGRMNWSDRTYAIGRGLAAIRAKDGKSHALIHGIISLNLPLLLTSATGSTFPNVSGHQLKELPVLIPPSEEMRGIARLLENIESKITSNFQLFQLLAQWTDTLSNSLSGSLRWVPLSELTYLNEKKVTPSTLSTDFVYHYSLPAFDEGATPVIETPRGIMSSKTSIETDSILVSRLNPRIDRTWWVPKEEGYPQLCSTEYACLSTPDNIALEIAWLAVRNQPFIDETRARVTGTSGSHQRVRPQDLLTIPVPDFREIDDETVSKVRNQLALGHHLKNENIKLAQLRATLLPELMSGRIRVPEAQEAVAEVIGD